MVVWHQTIIWNRDERERLCTTGPLSHLREAKPINSKKFVLSYQARPEQNHVFVWQYWRETQRRILCMVMRPSRIVNKTSSNAFLSVAYCENIIKITFFSRKCAGQGNILQKYVFMSHYGFCKLCQHKHKWQIFSLIQGFLHDSVNIKIGNITKQSCAL